MSGFEQLEEAIQQPQMVLTQDDVAFADQDLTDEAALSIVLQDAQTAEQYLQAKSLISGLDTADNLYRAHVKPRVWPNGKPRSAMPMYVVLEAIEKIVPALHLTLWGNGKDPFSLTPTGRTTPAAARAKGKVLSWAIKQAGMKEEMRRTLKTVLQYGFCVGNWGWEVKEKKIKKYVRNEAGKVVSKSETIEINQPTYNCLDLRQVLIDPASKTHDVRKSSRYIVFQSAITANELDDLRAQEGYKNIPTRDELAMILTTNGEVPTDSLQGSKTNSYRDLQAEPDFTPTTADPLQQDLELLEYWTDDRVITVLQRKIVIRNEPNEYGRKTQVSCAFIDVLNSAWGFGIAKLLSGEQQFQTGVRNSWVDSLALTMNPMWQLAKGIGAGTQQISASPGKVITESGELKPLVSPSVTTEALNAIGTSSEQANRLVGANGGASMPNQAMRTAQGIQAFSGDVIQRLQYFLEIFQDVVFVPVLEAFIEMCCDRLTPEQINAILTDEEGKAYEGDILDVYNATCKVEVVAGTKLTAKVAAAQLVPQLIAMVSAGPVQDSFVVQNKKFNYAELLEESLELMGWDIDSLIVDMTPEDQQRAQMMNAAVIKGQQDQTLEAQKHQNDLDKIDEKGTVQAGVAIVRNLVKDHQDEAMQTLEQMQNPMGAASE
jgi:hypothetical protein